MGCRITVNRHDPNEEAKITSKITEDGPTEEDQAKISGSKHSEAFDYGTRMRTKITIIDSAIEIEIATERPTEIDFAIEFGIDLVIEFPIDFVIVLAIDC